MVAAEDIDHFQLQKNHISLINVTCTITLPEIMKQAFLASPLLLLKDLLILPIPLCKF